MYKNLRLGDASSQRRNVKAHWCAGGGFVNSNDGTRSTGANEKSIGLLQKRFARVRQPFTYNIRQYMSYKIKIWRTVVGCSQVFRTHPRNIRRQNASHRTERKFCTPPRGKRFKTTLKKRYFSEPVAAPTFGGNFAFCGPPRASLNRWRKGPLIKNSHCRTVRG